MTCSFSVPTLAKIGAHHFGTEFGGFLSIDNFGEPLNVSLPQLTATNGAMIRGNLSEFVATSLSPRYWERLF
jgi:hypothetical protein